MIKFMKRHWFPIVLLCLMAVPAYGIAISALTAITGSSTASGDHFVIVDVSESAAADRTKRITRDELAVAIATGFANDAITGDDIEGGTIGTVTIGTLTLTNDLAVTQGGTGVSSLADLITLTTDTTGNYVLTVVAGDGISIAEADSEGATKTVVADLGTAIVTGEITDDTILEIDLDATDTASDEECLTFESGAGGDFEWQTCGAGDITDVFDCSTGDCASIVVGATDFLDFSGNDSSSTTEGLSLPQHATACATGFGEGQVCWEADADILHIGDGLAFEDFPAAAAISGDAAMSGTGALTIANNAVALTIDTTGNYADGDAEAGAALTGDSATSFFSLGTIEHERGGLELDVSAFGAGLYGQNSSFATIDIDTEAELETAAVAGANIILATEIDTSSEIAAIVTGETGTGVLVFGTSPTFTTGITVPANSISDDEIDEGATFEWTATHTNSAQPCFLASNSANDSDVTGIGTVATIDFDTEIYDQGSDFANDTFTAPVAGRYLLAGSVRSFGITSAADDIEMRMATSNRSYRHLTLNTDDLDTQRTLIMSIVVDMDASDTAIINLEVNGEATDVVDIAGNATLHYTYFSGCLLA